MPGGTPYDGLYGEAPPKIKGVPFSMLLDVVACCCPKFETGQTFQPTTPNISFVLWSPKRSATMLDPFAQLFQHCWGHARSLCMVYKDLLVVSFPRCTVGPNIDGTVLHPFVHHCQHACNNSQHCWRNNVGSCCVRLHVACVAGVERGRG